MKAPRAERAIITLLLAVVTACADRNALDDVIVVAAGDVHSPTVALDPTGARTFVAWVAGDSAYDVMLARRTGSGEFSAPVRVNSVPRDAAPHAQAPAQVAVGPDGNVYVLWQNNTVIAGRRFPASDLRFARSTDGGHTFEPTIFVNDDAGGAPASHTFHNLAVAADGTVYVSWIDGRANAESSEAGPQIRVARSTDAGRTFEPSVVVADRACPCCRTALAVAGRDVFVAWRDVVEGSIRDVVVARSRDRGRSWSAPTAVHADGWRIDGCPHAGPALATTTDGRVHVAWYTGAPDRAGIHYATADSMLAFGPPRALLSGEWVPPSLVALTGVGSDVIAAWDDRRADVPVLRVGDPLASASALRVNGLAPSLGAGGAHHVVTWLRNDTIFASRGGRELCRSACAHCSWRASLHARSQHAMAAMTARSVHCSPGMRRRPGGRAR